MRVSGNKATKPLVSTANDSIIPDNTRFKSRFFSMLLMVNNTERLVNIIIVFSSILLETDQIINGIIIQNNKGSHAILGDDDVLFQIRIMMSPVIKKVIKE